MVPPTSRATRCLPCGSAWSILVPFGLGWASGRPWFGRADERQRPRRRSRARSLAEDGRPSWRHLAGVWDGRAFWLHLDGQLVAVRRAAVPAEVVTPSEWIVSTGSGPPRWRSTRSRVWGTARATSEIAPADELARARRTSRALVQCLRFAH